MSQPPRRFFLPMIGLALLFAALGPAVGAALFIPLAVALAAPAAADAVGHFGAIAPPIGGAVALVAAYVLGVGPAAATGFVYALWDAAAPAGAPRSIAAALIGGAMTYALFLWLASLGASVEATIGADASPASGRWIDAAFSGDVGATLRHALIACGAASGLVCAMAASLVGLTTRGALVPAPPAPPPSGGA
ncbi:MAG: hypothetical protein ABR878_14460 [Roseiarcus sp.]